MKIKKKIVWSLLLIFTLAVLITACDTGEKPSQSNDKSTDESSGVSGDTQEGLFESEGVYYLDMQIDDSEKKITFLTHWNPDSGSYAEHIERFKKAYDIDIETIKSTYIQLPTKLASLQAGGDAPDTFLYYNAGFPSMFSKEMFEPIDDFIDFNHPYWASAKEASDKFKWNNKYYMVAGSNVSRVVWYNASIFERNGMDTPLELYENDEWTWEAFVEAAAELTQDTDGDGNIDQWGMAGNSFGSMMEASLNTSLIFMENNEIINNVMSPEIDFIKNLQYQITNIDNSFTWDWEGLFRAGKLAMVCEGTWIADSDDILQQMLKDEEIGFVPHPMFEDSQEKRYHAEYTGYLIPKGAKNIKGAQALLAYFKGYGDSDKAKEVFQNNMEEKNWSDKMLEFHSMLNYEPVLTGKVAAMPGDALRFAWEPLRRMQDENTDWAQMREEYYPLYQAEIDKEKASMKDGG